MAKYLVTGGAGFIGSHLVDALVEQQHEVVVLDNLSTGKVENLEVSRDRIEFVEGSVTDLATLRECCASVDCVFHQAALASVPRSVADPVLTHEHNASGTLNVFWAAKEQGVPRVVYASSSSVYGDTEELPKHEQMRPTPLSPYAVSKYIGELYGSVFDRLYGLSTIGLRYFNVFGPRQDPQSQYAAVVPLFITRFMAGEPPVIDGDGGQSRDFTFVRNVVEANLAAAAAPAGASGHIFNVACADRITIADLCARIRALVGAEIEPQHGPARAGDVRHSQADISLAAELMDYAPQIALDDGLDVTVQWYRQVTV